MYPFEGGRSSRGPYDCLVPFTTVDETQTALEAESYLADRGLSFRRFGNS